MVGGNGSSVSLRLIAHDCDRRSLARSKDDCRRWSELPGTCQIHQGSRGVAIVMPQYLATVLRDRNQAACLRSHQAITLAADLLDQLNG